MTVASFIISIVTIIVVIFIVIVITNNIVLFKPNQNKKKVHVPYLKNEPVPELLIMPDNSFLNKQLAVMGDELGSTKQNQ